jgi:3-hydroxybutyryl-CoA dehydrogenase
MSDVKVFGVVGAGQMGRGIAQVAAQTGFEVKLLDAKQEWANAGKEKIGRGLSRLVEKGRMEASEVESILGRIEATSDYGAFEKADMVVEAATEDLDVKQTIFRSADQAMQKEDAILASNTSSISLTKLAAVTKRPEKVIGMHFMNPVPVMKLVELVRALQTSDRTFDITHGIGEQMGKVMVSTKDMPGFIVNRMLIPFLNEGCFALQEGLGTVEDIDTATKLGLNHPMGPFELADLIGLDTVLYIGEVLHREFGDDKYRPPATLRNYVAAGWLGRKSGRGFYHYDERGKPIRAGDQA